MRDTSVWRTALVQAFDAARHLYGQISMPLADLLETELILTLFAHYLPNEKPSHAWAVLNGIPFPALTSLPASTQQAISCIRLHLRTPITRHMWSAWLKEYNNLPAPYPIYKIQNDQVIQQTTTIATNRPQIFQSALQSSPPWLRQHVDFAPAGIYQFHIDREPYEVEISARAATLAQQYSSRTLVTKEQREPVTVKLDDLITTAQWMDQSLGSDRWERTMREIQLRLIREEGFDQTDTLHLNGLHHMIGMLGSGKSTLLTILSTHLARKGLRVVLVYGDVATLLRELDIYEHLQVNDPQIQAVPLIGRSTRAAHLNRLHAAEFDRTKDALQLTHAGFTALSTLCPLDGLRQDVRPIPTGQEPCTTLVHHSKSDDKPHQYMCPFLPVCPVHQPSQRLLDATIWLATPASLLASSPQHPFVQERMRYIELAMWSADVVLVDEADMVQVQFDDRFAQTEVLIGRSDSWLDRLYTQVARQVYRAGRPLVGRSKQFDRWLIAQSNAQRSADCLIRLVRDDEVTRRWLRSSYFNGRRLFQRIAYDLEHSYACNSILFLKVAEHIADNPLGAMQGSYQIEQGSSWIEILQLELLGAERTTVLDLAHTSLLDLVPDSHHLNKQIRDTVASQIVTALVVTVLDYSLRALIAAWSSAEEVLELDKGGGGLFYPPSESVTRLIPESPTGPILGFQYYDAQDTGHGELRFFRLRGLGRALLYHLHDAFHKTDGVVGPHVLLTSGTSWAPGSSRYHLHIPPDYALLPIENNQTDKTRCFFTFVPDPDPRAHSGFIYVSGKSSPQDRINALSAMVRGLAKRTRIGGVAHNRFDKEFVQLPPHRRRALLVVGSYEEAEYVEHALAEALELEAGKAVVALIPDIEGDIQIRRPQAKLRRSNLARLPEMDGIQFLVAPLQAIERGHNILVGQEAAIGSIYFLTRPMPVPGDLHVAVQKLNAWALQAIDMCDTATIGEAGQWLRSEAAKRWHDVSSLHEYQGTYRGMSDEERNGILWTQLVLVWQCIGRLLRGGVPARVHFVDAKWAEVRSGLVPGSEESAATSMLVGFSQLLRAAIEDPDPKQAAIASALYGSFSQALSQLHTS
jgi:hypothetical protein